MSNIKFHHDVPDYMRPWFHVSKCHLFIEFRNWQQKNPCCHYSEFTDRLSDHHYLIIVTRFRLD